MNYPRLRYVEVFPVEVQGQGLICLRDPQNLSGKALFVSPEAVSVISLFDGKHSIRDIQAEFMKQFGSLLFLDELQGLINQLDEALLLDSENYRSFKNNLEREFINSGVRKSSHAGKAYPGDPNELESWIDGYFNEVGLPDSLKSDSREIKGIISPHIDFRRGGRSYALAYRELIKTCDADVFIVFGTSHYAEEVENSFILTRKNFSTPFGEVETDSEIIDKLVERCNWNLFEGEIAHRIEHSIEFQVVFLQRLFEGKRKFKIVPILCNSFFRMIQEGVSPREDKRISTFVDGVREIILSVENKVCVIAGADMAHIGPKFGDPEPVTESMLKWIKDRDLCSLSFTENLNPEGFFKSIEEEKDMRKICGLSPIYALLSTINAERGKLLDYDQALEPNTGSVVSFASVGFYS